MKAEWTRVAGQSGRAAVEVEVAAAGRSGASGEGVVRWERRSIVRRRDHGARRRSATAWIGGLVALGVAGTAPTVAAHTDGVAIPPESDYMIRWHQPHSVRPVDNWEIEVTPVKSPVGRFIARAQVMPEASCWALSVPIAEPATVRVRSVVGTQVSAWTRPTVVPEPGLLASLASATGALALLARRAGARARARSRRSPAR